MNSGWERILNFTREKKNIKEEKNINFEIKTIICVLAGGLTHTGRPHQFVIERLDKARELFKENPDNTIVLILGGGTYHKPPFLNSENYVVHESTSCSSYLIDKGISPSNIFREWSSYDTIANGFFAFTNYINLLDLNNIHVITSDFHISRTKLIFNYFNNLFKKNYNITYWETVSNIEKKTLKKRVEREKESSDNFKKNIVNKIKTPQMFLNWFYTHHKAYTSLIKYKSDYNINDTY